MSTDTLVTGREAEQLLGIGRNSIYQFTRTGRLKPVETRAGMFRTAFRFRLADVERLKAEVDARKSQRAARPTRKVTRAAKSRELATFTQRPVGEYIPVEDRVEPATHYGLLTDSDMREISRRRGKRAA